MFAVKANKQYVVNDTTKGTYLAQGYDIVDEKGNVTERSPQSTIKYDEYKKVVDENAALKAENEKLKVEIKKLKTGEA